ncbi:MAG: VOC family protein [Tepidisphaeraceae bacterium]
MKKTTKKKPRKSAGVDATLARNGGLSYLEIPADNPSQSAVFYQKVLGWIVQEPDGAHPKFQDGTGHLIGRWVSGRAVSREPGLLPYFYVEGVRRAVTRVVKYGGEIVKAPYPEGNLRVATVRDPSGNLIGLWEAASK